MGDSAIIHHPVFCDFCRSEGSKTEATYDARINGRSAWAFMCDHHFKLHGPARLGTGLGQRLELDVETPPPAGRRRV